MKQEVLTNVFFILILDFICVRCLTEKLDIRKLKPFELAVQWAPKLWLQKNEEFLPFNVEEYLKQMMLTNPKKPLGTSSDMNSDSPRDLQLPLLDQSWGYYLQTKENIDKLLKDKSSFLYGTNPSKINVPVYAYFRWCDSTFDHFFIHYWFFYSFNEGKEMCSFRGLPVPMVLPICLGKKRYYGSHVGDWEEVIIEFKNLVPDRLHLSVHSVGVTYQFDKETNSFVSPAARKKGITEIRNPPKSVNIVGGHPVIYAAKGSHAFWGSVGKHSYTKYVGSSMVDQTEEGIPWESWQDLQLFHSPESTPPWFQYYGKWGNPQSDCLLKTGICRFNDGPPGLGQRQSELQC